MPRHIPSLDGLRAIAVLLVLWCHVPVTLTGYPDWLLLARWWLEPGDLGVELFFALSGFLITRILLAEQAAHQPVRWFLLRRMLRIFPIYYLLLLVMLFWRPGAEIGWCALYLGNFADVFSPTPGFKPLGHTWSLCVEEHFYLLWPMVIACCGSATGARVLKWVVIPVAVVGAVLVGILCEQRTAELAVYRLSPFRFLTLACGALVAYAEPRLMRSPRRTFAMGVGLTVLGLLLHPHIWFAILPILWLGGVDSWPMELAPAAIRIHVAITSIGILLWCLVPRSCLASPAGVLAISPLRAIGRISYGLYLYHLPIFRSVIHSKQTWLSVLVALVLTFAIATASYWLVERPILKYAARFRNRPRNE